MGLLFAKGALRVVTALAGENMPRVAEVSLDLRVLLLSGLGSAGAWFRSYLKRDEKTNNSSLRDRLRQMIPEARQATSVEELDQMQAAIREWLPGVLPL